MEHTKEGHLFTEIVLETFKLSGLLTVEGDSISAPLGLTSARWKILGAIKRTGTPCTVPQIARNMGQSRQAVQTLVNAMHKTGLVEFQTNPNHKRAHYVSLTAQGHDLYEKMDAIQIPWANERGAGISEKDLITTLETLRKLSGLF